MTKPAELAVPIASATAESPSSGALATERRPAAPAATPAASGPTAPGRLSASALNRYRTCAKQFWFAHVERAPTSREPSPQLAQANAIHNALERFFGLAPEVRSADTLERALRSVWTSYREPGTFANRDEEAAYGREAVSMLRRFAQTGDIGTVPLAREQWLTRRLENGAVLFGKLDRIDRVEGRARADRLQDGPPPARPRRAAARDRRSRLHPARRGRLPASRRARPLPLPAKRRDSRLDARTRGRRSRRTQAARAH